MKTITRSILIPVAGLLGTVALAAPSSASAGGGEDPVSGPTQALCESAGAAQAQVRNNQGYVTTFVGCSLGGNFGPIYVGTVHYRPTSEPSGGGQDPVTGYTQDQCDAAGAAQAQVRKNEGYTTMFIGCSPGASAGLPYAGTVHYHFGPYA